jgi:hypothetical protein
MQALKLDSSYRPIDIIDAFDAFSMVWCHRAKMVESYKDITFKSTHSEWEVPCVIVLNRYIPALSCSMVCNRKNVLWRDKYICQYCGNRFPYEKLTLDHVIPSSRGGPKTWENIVCCCKRCNQEKGSMLLEEASMELLASPKEPSYNQFRAITKKEIHEKWYPYLQGISYQIEEYT